MAKLHGFTRNSEFITDFDGEFDGSDVKESKRPRYLRQLSTTESPSNPFDPHRAETMDEWVESHDVVVTVSTTKKAYDRYRWNEERIQRTYYRRWNTFLIAWLYRDGYTYRTMYRHCFPIIFDDDVNYIEFPVSRAPSLPGDRNN